MVTDFKNEPAASAAVFASHGRPPCEYHLDGEHARHPELSVLTRGADGQVNGRTYRKVMGLLAIKAFPQAYSRAAGNLSEPEHGDATRRFEPSEGANGVQPAA